MSSDRSSPTRSPRAPGVHPQPLLEPPPAIRSRGRRRGRRRTSCCTGSRRRSASASLDWSYSFWLGTVSAALLLAARPLRAAAAVPLRAVGRARLRVGQGHRVRRHVRLVDPLRAPHSRAPDGRGRLPAPGARVPDRRLQERRRPGAAARVELGASASSMLLADAVPLVHRVPAAVGPARVLGGHRRHQHRLVDPARRPARCASC